MIAAPHDLDIVFFRNVSIYFDTAERLAIHKNLAALMREESVLITGLTETMANDLGVFHGTHLGGVIAVRGSTPCHLRSPTKVSSPP